MSRVHVVLLCNLIGATTARQWKLTTFPADVPQALSSFLRTEPGEQGLRAQCPWLVRTLMVQSHFECIHTHQCL